MLSSWLSFALVVSAAAPDAITTGERLVTGTGLRVRAAPDANAAVVEKVALGAVLSCVELSKPVTVGETTAPFCKTAKGWYFTALTEPAAAPAQRNAQLDALIDARAQAIGDGVAKEHWPDVYAVNDLMRRRIDARSGDDKLRARIAELTFVARFAYVFDRDPRVARDESQGPRVNNTAFEELLTAAKGTSAHEDAAWALYQHGLGGECEGDPVCNLIRLDRTACRFLSVVQSGERAGKAIDDVNETLTSLRGDGAAPVRYEADIEKDARAQLAKVRVCVDRAKSGDTAKAKTLLDQADKAWK